ncbi:MAG: DUF5070 domain-containing protein [Victivallaceae bacterium]
MRFVLAPGYQTEFNTRGSVCFTKLADSTSCRSLYSEISNFIKEKTDSRDDRSYRCLFRSLPSVERFIYRQGLADFASALLSRRPLWLVYDEFMPYPRSVEYVKKDHEDCILLLNLRHKENIGDGIFFCEKLPESVSSRQSPGNGFLLLSFSYVRMPQHCPMFNCS